MKNISKQIIAIEVVGVRKWRTNNNKKKIENDEKKKKANGKHNETEKCTKGNPFDIELQAPYTEQKKRIEMS